MRRGGCSWRKITFRSGSFNARHALMGRQASAASRGPVPDAPQKTAIGLNLRAGFSIGRTSFSQTSTNGSNSLKKPNMSRKHLPAPVAGIDRLFSGFDSRALGLDGAHDVLQVADRSR
jgi:hypothetical protein